MLIVLRCYAELNEYLPAERKFVPAQLEFPAESTVASLISSQGIPDEVVDLVLVDGESQELMYRLNDGEMVSLFPVFESFDITGTTKVRIRALREVRFVLDVHLGKLASHLRMLGFDTLYRNDYADDRLVSLSVDRHRILLSKDRALIADPTLTHAYRIRSQDPREQLLEVLGRFDLAGGVHPFTRCIECNSILEPADKQRVLHRLPPKVALAYDEFRLCPHCDRIYWRGSHVERMREFIRALGLAIPEDSP